MTGRVGEGLDREDRVAPAGKEVFQQAPQDERDHLRGEVRSPVRLEHAIALIVGEIAQPAVALGVAPANRDSRSEAEDPAGSPLPASPAP